MDGKRRESGGCKILGHNVTYESIIAGLNPARGKKLLKPEAYMSAGMVYNRQPYNCS